MAQQILSALYGTRLLSRRCEVVKEHNGAMNAGCYYRWSACSFAELFQGQGPASVNRVSSMPRFIAGMAEARRRLPPQAEASGHSRPRICERHRCGMIGRADHRMYAAVPEQGQLEGKVGIRRHRNEGPIGKKETAGAPVRLETGARACAKNDQVHKIEVCGRNRIARASAEADAWRASEATGPTSPQITGSHCRSSEPRRHAAKECSS
jgi:hypothetical protein